MSERPESFGTANFETESNFPRENDHDLDIKISNIIKALGIAQTPQEEFLDTMEAELVTSIDQNAHLALEAEETSPKTSSSNTAPLSLAEQEAKQLKLIEKKLKLYQTTQENIKKEISRLLAISNSKNISPENAKQINNLIVKMRSLDDRIAFYTKQDQTLRQKQQEREQYMIQMRTKKQLAEQIKLQKKELLKQKAELNKKDLSSFFLAGKWLEIHRKNQLNLINNKEKKIARSEAKLKELEQESTKKAVKTAPLSPSVVAKASTAPTTAVPKKAAVITQPIPLPTETIRDREISPPTPSVPRFEPQRPAIITPTPQKPRELFADLFASPVVKGSAPRGPDSQSGRVMQAAEQSRNTGFTKQAESLRLQEQRSGAAKTKKTT